MFNSYFVISGYLFWEQQRYIVSQTLLCIHTCTNLLHMTLFTGWKLLRMPNVTFSFSWCDKFQSISTGNSENNTTLRISKHDKKLNHIVTRKNNIFIYFHIFILYQLTSLMLRQFNRAINNVNNLIRKIVFTYGTFVFFL